MAYSVVSVFANLTAKIRDQTPNIAKRLSARIEASTVSKAEKEFLIQAAKRHNVFNYRLIADYYSHASIEMQRLMEESALVIIDFDSAIKNGYVKYSNEINELYRQECDKR